MVIYGGTFDPPHNGHIKTAINVQNHFNFESFLFLPCKIPVLKDHAVATPAQRIAMLNLALGAEQNNFKIDLSEINRDTPSYMVESLKHFRKKFGEDVSITLLIGADTFSQLPYWHDWKKLLTLANLLVIKRAGFKEEIANPVIKELLLKYGTQDDKTIMEHAYGAIYCFDAGDFNFSSTWIREQLLKKQDLTGYLPEKVMQYIDENGLYS